MNRRNGRAAFIDESHYERSDTGHFYTMTAAVIDFARQDSYRSMMLRLSRLAHRQSSRTLHARDMAAPGGHTDDLMAAQQAITSCDAVRLIITVRTPMKRVSTVEQTRQVCLADLATRIQEHGTLDRIILDTRDPLGHAHQSSKAVPGGANHHDLTTLNDLKKAGELDPSTLVIHANDDWATQLWIPDVAGYVVSRSIARGDPGYMSLLAPKVELYEALTLPVAMRTTTRESLTPTAVGIALADHVCHSYALLRTPDSHVSPPKPIHDVPDDSDRRQVDPGQPTPVPTLDQLIRRSPEIVNPERSRSV